MKEIRLIGGGVSFIDDEDYEMISKFPWFVLKCQSGKSYAARHEGTPRRLIKMHRVLLKAPSGLLVDHINGNGLDNRRCNLRIATKSQNRMYAKINKNNTSGFAGVYFKKDRNKWYAGVRCDGKFVHLGYFVNLSDAVSERIRVARSIFGDFCMPIAQPTNFLASDSSFKRYDHHAQNT